MGTSKNGLDTDMEKKLLALKNVVIKYHSELDTRVNFPQLQDAIDAIEKAMQQYEGKAKLKLQKVRALNTSARLTYNDCVGQAVEWSIYASKTLTTVLPSIAKKDLPPGDRTLMLGIISTVLKNGLEKIKKSLDQLKNVLKETNQLSDLFKSIDQDVHDDFGPNGFYGKAKCDLEEGLNKTKKSACKNFDLGGLCSEFGQIVFGPLGRALGLAVGVSAALGVETITEWMNEKNPKKKLKGIMCIFEIITQKIGHAVVVVCDVIKALEEDQAILIALSAKSDSANDVSN